MTARAFGLWYKVHKWTSLICTVFLLLLCLTGLPLVFHDELTAPPVDLSRAADRKFASLDRIVAAGRQTSPREVVTFVSKPIEDNGTVSVYLAPSVSAPPKETHPVLLNEYTAEVLPPRAPTRFLEFVLDLHTDLCAGPTGSLILFLMAILFLASLVSGVVVYGPFTRHWRFGDIRSPTQRRARWLDLHNLLGMVTLGWVFVVGFTGSINALSPFIAGLWQSTELRAMAAPFEHQPAPTKLGSPQAALDSALREQPGNSLVTLAFPGTPFATPRHYGVYLHGSRPLTSRILKPFLIDSETGILAAHREMPWYVKTLFLSEPLHFGDYGGFPLKLLWAAFDVVAIVVLVSGLSLWRLRAV